VPGRPLLRPCAPALLALRAAWAEAKAISSNGRGVAADPPRFPPPVVTQAGPGISCGSLDWLLLRPAHGTNPMEPYVFSTAQSGGLESGTSLRLSAATVAYRHERKLRFSVVVRAVFGGAVTGNARISDGRKAVCTIKLADGKGSCTPTSNTEIAPGEYSINAFYAGSKSASKSNTRALTVKN